MKTSCEGCVYNLPSRVYGNACYRRRRYASGLVVQATPNAGFSADLETHPIDGVHEGRADLDWCGPERRHYKAGDWA